MARLKKTERPELAIHKAVADHLNRRGVAGMFWWHTPNGGARHPREGAIFKSIGVKAGVPDIVAIHRGRCYGLELKAENGRPTEPQLAVKAAMDRAGAFTAICYGLDPAIRCLETWGLLRGETDTFESVGDVAARVVSKLRGAA